VGEVGKLAPPGRGGRTGQDWPRVLVWVLAIGEDPNEYPHPLFVYLFALGEWVTNTYVQCSSVSVVDKGKPILSYSVYYEYIYLDI